MDSGLQTTLPGHLSVENILKEQQEICVTQSNTHKDAWSNVHDLVLTDHLLI